MFPDDAETIKIKKRLLSNMLELAREMSSYCEMTGDAAGFAYLSEEIKNLQELSRQYFKENAA